MPRENIEQYKGVFIFAQQVDNELSGIALELLGKAKDLANDLDEKKVTAVLLGENVGKHEYQRADEFCNIRIHKISD